MKYWMSALGLLALGLSPIAMAETTSSSGGAVTAAPASWAATDGAVIDFTVLRKGKRFGQHRLTFDRLEDGSLTVTTDVDLSVRIGPITAYRYRLDSVENWKDGQLIALEGTANNNGRRGRVTVSQSGDELKVDSTEFNGALPVTTIPSSHWNRLQVYQDQMLSTESGEVLDIEVEALGRETVLVGGDPVEATRYRLQSDLTVDIWYDDQSRWVKLAFEVRDQSIEYVLNALY